MRLQRPFIAVVLLRTVANGFTIVSQCRHSQKPRLATASRRWNRSLLSSSATTTESPSTEMSTATAADVLQQLGIEEGKLALGLKPSEVLKYIGTCVSHVCIGCISASCKDFLMCARTFSLFFSYPRIIDNLFYQTANSRTVAKT
jgi:hypothetical protein